MIFSEMSDNNILSELGNRVRQLRLRHNLTQQQLAKRTLLSLNTIKALESGRAKLATLVVVLRELGRIEALEQFLPDPGISPMQLAKRRGRQRKRATGRRGGKKHADTEVSARESSGENSGESPGAQEGVDW